MAQFKSMMFAAAGTSGDKKIVAAATEMFSKYVKGDKEAIHPNLRGAVYSIVLEVGGEKEYEGVLDIYRHAKTADERNTALRAIGRAKDPKLIQRTLDYSLSEEVRSQDIYMPLSGLRAHKEGIEALWQWATEHWEILVKKLPPGLSMLGSLVQICTSSFTHKDQLEAVQKFYKERSTKGFDQSLSQALDSIRAKENWLERDSEDVKKWLEENKYC